MSNREGNLDAPTRHPLDWTNPDFYDEDKLHTEMERVFDLCHGCRRCLSLCGSFPTMFDLIDATEDGEVHGVDKKRLQDSRRSMFFMRRLLCNKVPLCAAAPLEPRFSASDVACQSGEF